MGDEVLGRGQQFVAVGVGAERHGGNRCASRRDRAREAELLGVEAEFGELRAQLGDHPFDLGQADLVHLLWAMRGGQVVAQGGRVVVRPVRVMEHAGLVVGPGRG